MCSFCIRSDDEEELLKLLEEHTESHHKRKLSIDEKKLVDEEQLGHKGFWEGLSELREG